VLWTAPGTVQQPTTTTLKLNADGTGTVTVAVAGGAVPTNSVDLWIDNTWQRAYTLTNGTAAINLGTQPLGDHTIRVAYRPSSTAAGSTTSVLWTTPGTVLALTTTTLKLNTDGTGTVTVAVAGGSTPTNVVDLWIDGTWQRAYTLTNGTAAIDLGALPGGDHKITVRYRASSTTAASSTTLWWTAPGTVQAATSTTLSLDADGMGTVKVVVAGGAVPTNLVDLWIDNTWQRAYTLTNGTTAINLGTQPLGDHTIRVAYRPSTTAAGSTTSVLWTAPGTVQALTTTTLKPNTDNTGTVTVAVADGSTPTNLVDLWIDGTWQRAYTLTNDTAAIDLGAVPGGDHKITVRYRPSSTAAASSASVIWMVVTADQLPTTTTVSVLPDGTGTIGVEASGQPGTSPVDMWVGGRYKGVFQLTNGKATFSLGTRAGGDVQVSVRYRPNPTQLASTAQAVWSVNTAAMPSPGACGEAILKDTGEAWSCTFADDFAGTALNSNLWRVHTEHYTGGEEVKACNVDSPDNVSVGNGALHLTVRSGTPVTCMGLDGEMTPYTSGRVTTYHAWSQQYGRFEARLKTTASSQPGLHEGFWMWPDTRYPEGQLEWPSNGEIDIVEMRSNDPLRAVPFLHSADDLLGSITSGSNANTAWDCTAERGVWNTYTMEWAPNRIEIFVNGESCLVNTSGNEAFKKRYIMVLSQGLGTLRNSLTSSTTLPATLSVDYVRVWS
jgi:beta-glucanase (GH16 family)/3D (Asp-Asp-Asp) domain-containing protein